MSGAVVWLTGLPRSGKSTLARALAERLRARGELALLLDGDEVRDALSPRPGYDDASRDAFYSTLGALAALLARQGAYVLVPATANLRRYRDQARERTPRFFEVHVASSVDECAARDRHGLYRSEETRARLPGVGAPYEPPLHPDVVAAGGRDEHALERALALVTSEGRVPAPS